LTPTKVDETPRFQKFRVLVLAREGRFARRMAAELESLGVSRQAHVVNLGAATSALLDGDTDLVIAEIHSDYSDGLMLPSALKELSTSGRLKLVPHVVWAGEGATVSSGGARMPTAAPSQEARDMLNGVSLAALASHARLARTAGIQMQIVRDGGIGGLRAALEKLLDAEPSPVQLRRSEPTKSPAEDDVIAALTSGEGLRVVFQPQYDLMNRTVVGAEVLIRWQHARYGDVPPAVLIPMVNRLGLDLLLFSYIEKRAVDTLLALDRAGIDIPLAVNASAKTICTPGLAERLAGKMKRAGLPAKRLKIELTEELTSVDELSLSASITALRAKGIQVSLDDFGAGSATLALLSQMPFDEMKIDGTLVRAVALTPASREIIVGIVALARLFNLRLVTEGIEDESTIALLCELGCRIGQGYALARPMENEDFLRNAVMAPAFRGLPRGG
jgi:EAL domain-containing protein (putative c-di-GMP-specific phosphodiesterase class I)